MLFVFAIALTLYACKNETNGTSETATDSGTKSDSKARTGQAFIKDTGSTTVLSRAMDS
ncbi:hypothetical protein [Olleya sp. HaHaR_3_96]|uniref:hypothetical protein n=1 Tax=Olleya sp. HaHaR_3_96 TaxID=2745560 RepID=UPI00295001B2|nr:hypothetical protein [Olleya sp. HaHaR_3_96]